MLSLFLFSFLLLSPLFLLPRNFDSCWTVLDQKDPLPAITEAGIPTVLVGGRNSHTVPRKRREGRHLLPVDPCPCRAAHAVENPSSIFAKGLRKRVHTSSGWPWACPPNQSSHPTSVLHIQTASTVHLLFPPYPPNFSSSPLPQVLASLQTGDGRGSKSRI